MVGRGSVLTTVGFAAVGLVRSGLGPGVRRSGAEKQLRHLAHRGAEVPERLRSGHRAGPRPLSLDQPHTGLLEPPEDQVGLLGMCGRRRWNWRGHLLGACAQRLDRQSRVRARAHRGGRRQPAVPDDDDLPSAAARTPRGNQLWAAGDGSVALGACVLADIGSCGAPCTGSQDRLEYAEIVAAVRSAMVEDARPVVRALAERITTLAAQQRYEDAAAVRDRLSAFLRGAARAQRYRPVANCPELVAARRATGGGWEIVVVRYGRLAATTTVGPGADPGLSIEALRACAEQVSPPVPPAPAAHPEEADLLLSWLDSPGVRLVSIDSAAGWSCPVRGAQAHQDLGSTAELVQQRADWQGALQVVGQGAQQVVGAGPA